MSRCWIAVASAAHVRRGRAGGFMQLGHGKRAPLLRVRPGDRIAYYSPAVTLGGKDRLRAFTAIGTVRAGEPYTAELEGDVMYRRDVDWEDGGEAPIEPLVPRLELTTGAANWGSRLRFGLIAVSARDLARIAAAMAAAKGIRSKATAPRRR